VHVVTIFSFEKTLSFWRQAATCRFGIFKKIPISIALHCPALLRQRQLDQTHMLLTAVPELEE